MKKLTTHDLILGLMLVPVIGLILFAFNNKSQVSGSKQNNVIQSYEPAPPDNKLFPYYQIFHPDSLISGNSRVINSNSTTDSISFKPNANFEIEDDNVDSIRWSNGYYSVLTVNNKIVSVVHYLDNNNWKEYFKN
jgi:hypothetical protein